MTRAEALANGLSVYFTGNPCKQGHIADRWVANWTCVVCHAKRCAEFLPKWREKNPEKTKAYSQKYAKVHAEQYNLQVIPAVENLRKGNRHGLATGGQ